MTKSTVWIAMRMVALLVLVSVSGFSMAAESATKSSAPYVTVMFVVSVPEKAEGIFKAIQDEKGFKDSDCTKPTAPTNYTRDFLKPKNWQKFKYGKLLFFECRNPSPDTFQLFAQASLKASAESPGRTVKVLVDTITVSTSPCRARYCSIDNSFHQAYPSPQSACGYCP